MLFRILFTISVIPILLALVARWWFALRVLATDGRRSCRCDLTLWQPASKNPEEPLRSDLTAAKFGLDLREKALADWNAADPKAYRSRQSALRFALASPPLSGIVAIFAVLGGKVPFLGALSIPLAFIALAAVAGVLSLPPELRAIQHALSQIRRNRSFPNRDDEDAVARCAVAWAWEHSIPPILRWLTRGSG